MNGRALRTSQESTSAPTTSSDVFVRAVSALVLAVVALLATWAAVWTFALLLAVGAIVAAGEWGRLVRIERLDPSTVCHAVSLVAAILLTAFERAGLAFLALAAGLALVGVLAKSRADAKWSMLGVLYLGIPCIALMSLRDDSQSGWLAIAFLFTIVWCADTAAYAGGRLIGGPRLAPAISPAKTWAGFAAGVGVPVLLGCVWAVLLGNTSWMALALLAMGLALAAQIGDLAESAAKRRFRVKDASQLIPGHGGLLDRIDGLLFASLVAGAIVAGRQSGQVSSGAALLIWT